MVSKLLLLIGYPLVLILIITIVSAVMLAIGTALTFLFAVSVWEATVVVMVVTAVTYWLHYQGGAHDDLDPLVEYPEVELDEELQPRITVTDFVVRPNRRSRRRRQ